ncbi:hypothetical protein TrispH2_007231 [Trichoplax sp. H2]|nr:hypothetical protein TrispH2_007231 [Trichoplax sp. H2]|eukprot:RDD40627.1 hypothetical protein TrispH2_007231 [Trichoplax sp. H2]
MSELHDGNNQATHQNVNTPELKYMSNSDTGEEGHKNTLGIKSLIIKAIVGILVVISGCASVSAYSQFAAIAYTQSTILQQPLW